MKSSLDNIVECLEQEKKGFLIFSMFSLSRNCNIYLHIHDLHKLTYVMSYEL